MAYKTSREKMNEDHAAVMRNYLAGKERERNAPGVTRTASTGSGNVETNRVKVPHGPIHGVHTGVPTHDVQGRKRASTDKEWEATPEHARTQDPPSVERALREGAELEAQDRQEAAQQRQNRVTDKKIRRDPILRKVKASVLASTPESPTGAAQNRNQLLDNEVERQRKHEAAYQREQQQKRQRML